MQTTELEKRVQGAIELEERKALKLGFYVRLVTMGIIALWLLFQLPFREFLYLGTLLLGFVISGWLPYKLAHKGPWWKYIRYLFPLMDMVLLTISTLAPNPMDIQSYPRPVYLKMGLELYFFPVIASSIFYYSPRVVIWAGFCAALTWGIGTLWIANMPDVSTFSNATLSQLSNEMEVSYLMDPSKVHLDILGTQSIVFMLVAGCLALAVHRFRLLMVSSADSERRRTNLARHFSPNMVDELSNMDGALGTARSQKVGILFADIVGFTKFAEANPPEKVLDLLRDVLGLMAKQVFLNEGTLDKYLGDGIMATFGTPHGGVGDAKRAMSCAKGILNDVAVLNERRVEAGDPPIEIGIGLHYGPVVLGDIGDENRLEFTVIGDTVNVASRLEGLTRDLGVQFVVSEDLVDALGDEDQSLVENMTKTEPQSIRGHEKPMPVRTM